VAIDAVGTVACRAIAAASQRRRIPPCRAWHASYPCGADAPEANRRNRYGWAWELVCFIILTAHSFAVIRWPSSAPLSRASGSRSQYWIASCIFLGGQAALRSSRAWHSFRALHDLIRSQASSSEACGSLEYCWTYLPHPSQ